jgi:adenylate cyclase
MSAWVRGLIGTLAVLALAQVSGISQGLDRWLTDTHWRWRAASQPAPLPQDLVVVAADDTTINDKGFGRLKNWSRQKYADLLTKLSQAKVVGFDIVFSDPDRNDQPGDAALVAAVKRHGRVVIPAYQWREARPFSKQTEMEMEALFNRWPKAPSPGQLPQVYPHSIQPPFPELTAAAAALGYADVNADPDGVYRRPEVLKFSTDGRFLPHFTLAVAALGRRTSFAEVLKEAPGQLRFGDRTVPLDEGAIWLQPVTRAGGTYAKGVGQPVPTISFSKAVQARPEEFKDKIVLVGETATGTTDIRPNPLDPSLRGVELNAEILANLLTLPPVRPLPLGVQWGLIFLAAGLPLWLYSAFSPRVAAGGAAMSLIVLLIVMEGGFWAGRMVPAWSPVLVGFLSSTLWMGLQRLGQEEALKRQLRQSFALYAPPELVESIVRNPKIIHEGGTRQRVAVLFSDIRSFTSYSEQNPPELVVRQMGEYLSEMTEAVFNHRGILDKFIGDAVMALYGPFLEEDANVSARAVASALEMLERLDRLNEGWAEAGLPLFRIGIGIHIGDAIVGNIGTPRRIQYTALGDTVNLSARLQTATKDFKAVMLVSEDVKQEAEPLLGKLAEFEDRGELTVRGREQAVRVYEVRRREAPQEAHVHEASAEGLQPV